MIVDERIKGFLDGIIKVYRIYSLSLSHEDTEGAFIIQNYKEENCNLILNAFDETGSTIENKKEKEEECETNDIDYDYIRGLKRLVDLCSDDLTSDEGKNLTRCAYNLGVISCSLNAKIIELY